MVTIRLVSYCAHVMLLVTEFKKTDEVCPTAAYVIWTKLPDEHITEGKLYSTVVFGSLTASSPYCFFNLLSADARAGNVPRCS